MANTYDDAIREQHILIVAVMHLQRQPNYRTNKI